MSSSSLNRSTAKDEVFVIKIKIMKEIRNRIFIVCIDHYQIRNFANSSYQISKGFSEIGIKKKKTKN